MMTHPKHERKTFLQRHLGPVLTLPALTVIFGVLVIPVVYALMTSFSKVNPSDHSLSFTGLANYAKIFSDKYFWNSLKLTLVFTVVTVFAEIVLGVGAALVLNQPFRGRGFVRGVMILPWMDLSRELRRSECPPFPDRADQQIQTLAGDTQIGVLVCGGSQHLERDTLCGPSHNCRTFQHLQRLL